MRKRIQKIREFLRVQIWDHDVSQLPWIQGFAVRQIRVAIILAKGFLQGGLALRASSMTFTTLLTLVPLLIVAFTIFRAVGGLPDLEARMEQFLYQNLMPGAQSQIRGWLEGFFSNIRSGAFGGVTILFLLGGVLGLLTTIESSFNDIWGVKRGRSVWQRLSTFTTLVVFSPFLIGLSLSMTANLESSALLSRLVLAEPDLSGLVGWGLKILPVLLTGVALTILYAIMPNARVRLRAALPSGLAAAIIWEFSKIGYTSYLKYATHYSTIYGSLAAFPLFLVWVYVSWMVVLFGAQLTFAQEAADDIREEEMASSVSQTERLRVAFLLVLEAARNYRNSVSPPAMTSIARRAGLPLRLLRDVAGTLTEGRILNLVHGSDDGGLVPARSPDQITVHDVYLSVLDHGHVPSRGRHPQTRVGMISDQILGQISRGLREHWTTLTLSECLDRIDHEHGSGILPFTQEGET